MKKVVLAMFVCCVSTFKLAAQPQQVFNVPSPEVANLGLYGQVPVSYYTGVPDISVPLYEVKLGDFTMPIAASYHIGSVKPNQTPGPLGLGWNLIAGGYITRTVRMLSDERVWYNSKEHKNEAIGLYGHTKELEKLKSLWEQYANDNENSELEKKLGDAIKENLTNENGADLSADEFSFNFLGYSGNFYLNENGEWTVVSDQDIKVEFDPETGFVDIEAFRNKYNNSKTIDVRYWTYDRCSKRFFKQFTLITPDGSRFEFGGLNAMEFSISYYNRNDSPLYATTWRLTKIITPDKRTISIEYETDLLSCDLQFVPNRIEVKDVSKEINGNWWSHFLLGEYKWDESQRIDNTGKRAFTGDLLLPVLIKKIVTPNETIEFSYTRDKNFGRLFIPNGSWPALYWDDKGMLRPDLQRNIYKLGEPADQFFALVRGVGRHEEKETRLAIADSLAYYYLTDIVVKKQNKAVLDYNFTYEVNNRRKLSSIVKRRGSLAISGNVFGRSITDGEEYHFKYNTSMKMPKWFLIGKTDSWGYYHGDNNIFADANWDFVYPNTAATKAEILTEIQYPTGGRTRFEYEQNRYSWMVDSIHNIQHSSGRAGGLRVSKITNYNRDNQIVSAKKYYYSKSKNSECSGILKEMPHNIFYHLTIDSKPNDKKRKVLPFFTSFYGRQYTITDRVAIQKSSMRFNPPVTNMNSPIVGYSWVIEETLDSLNNSIGYVRYHYSNYDAGIDGKNHLDERALVCYNRPVYDAMASYTSLSFERGQLLSKEYFDKDDVLFKKECYNYSRTTHKPLFTIYQNYITYLNLITCDFTYTHTASYLPVSVTETVRSTDGQMVEYKTQTYEYNDHKKLKKETCTMSDGSKQSVSYTYPFDYSKYDWMTSRNITDPVIEKKMTAGGMTRTETNEYGSCYGIPYIQKRTIGNGNSVFKTEYEVKKVDSYGNPVEVVIDGVNNILCWGHQGQRLLLRVENADFLKLKYLLGLNGTSADYSKLVNGRSKVPSALFHIYKYNSDLQLESETTPNGVTTFYGYDHFGRLKEVYYISGGEKKLLKSYGYQYYNDKYRKL